MHEMSDAASDAGCAGAVEICIKEIHADGMKASDRPLQPITARERTEKPDSRRRGSRAGTVRWIVV